MSKLGAILDKLLDEKLLEEDETGLGNTNLEEIKTKEEENREKKLVALEEKMELKMKNLVNNVKREVMKEVDGLKSHVSILNTTVDSVKSGIMDVKREFQAIKPICEKAETEIANINTEIVNVHTEMKKGFTALLKQQNPDQPRDDKKSVRNPQSNSSGKPEKRASKNASLPLFRNIFDESAPSPHRTSLDDWGNNVKNADGDRCSKREKKRDSMPTPRTSRLEDYLLT